MGWAAALGLPKTTRAGTNLVGCWCWYDLERLANTQYSQPGYSVYRSGRSGRLELGAGNHSTGCPLHHQHHPLDGQYVSRYRWRVFAASLSSPPDPFTP